MLFIGGGGGGDDGFRDAAGPSSGSAERKIGLTKVKNKKLVGGGDERRSNVNDILEVRWLLADTIENNNSNNNIATWRWLANTKDVVKPILCSTEKPYRRGDATRIFSG